VRLASRCPGLDWLRMTLPCTLGHINLWLPGDELDGCSGIRAVGSMEDCAGKRATTELSESI
jgi:hypothetical protein